MPFAEHPSFTNQPADDAFLSRYTDLPNLILLLHRKRLHFTRLGLMQDPYEGAWPRRPAEELHAIDTQDMAPEELAGYEPIHQRASDVVLKTTHVSCWHEGFDESAAMWSLYSRHHGIAIRTTFRRLALAITDERPVYIARMDYIDYETFGGWTTLPNLLRLALLKRRSFEHEHEVRAVAVDHSWLITPGSPIPDGIDISVDVDLLIESIRIAPHSPQWHAEAVAAAASALGYHGPINRSAIDSPPLW